MASGGTSRDPLTLGIDTVSDMVSLALMRGETIVAIRAWTATETVTRALLAGIDALLREAGVDRRALERIAVDVGPGRYGALRAGVATAQGLALGLEVPLAGTGRFEADALPHLFGDRVVVAVHEAGRSGYGWAAYAAGTGRLPHEIVAPRLDELDALAREAPRGALWCGELGEDLRRMLAVVEAPPAPQPRAVAVALLAHRRDAFGDPAAVDAVYLRPPPITLRRRPG